QAGTWYPVLSCDGVFMLPGVPELFRAQLEAVLLRVEGTPLFVKALFVSEGEAEIAAVVDRVALSSPEVAIGSYPTFDRSAGYKVKLTVEGAGQGAVDGAVDRLMAELPAGSVLRVE
ncbi:MAG: competence/damage-inducible protein A, partial [Myxococcaceae bacterium]